MLSNERLIAADSSIIVKWNPYFIVILSVAVVMGLCLFCIIKIRRRNRARQKPTDLESHPSTTRCEIKRSSVAPPGAIPTSHPPVSRPIPIDRTHSRSCPPSARRAKTTRSASTSRVKKLSRQQHAPARPPVWDGPRTYDAALPCYEDSILLSGPWYSLAPPSPVFTSGLSSRAQALALEPPLWSGQVLGTGTDTGSGSCPGSSTSSTVSSAASPLPPFYGHLSSPSSLACTSAKDSQQQAAQGPLRGRHENK